MIAKDIKRGSIVVYEGAPCIIESISVQSPSARGAATFYKFRARNASTKQKVDITLRGGESLDEADFEQVDLVLTDLQMPTSGTGSSWSFGEWASMSRSS